MGHLSLKCWLVALPVLAAALLAAGSDLVADPRPHPACRILPNAMVPVLAGRSAGCELEPYDRVIAIRSGAAGAVEAAPQLRKPLPLEGGSVLELLVLHRGHERWTSVPLISDTRGWIVGRFVAAVVVAAVVMAVSLMILWGSSEPAATPFACFYSCASVVLFSVLCGRYSDILVLPGVVAGGLIPATLAHIALTFPREREIVRRSPPVIAVVYGFSLLLTLIAVVNLERSPTVWALADRVILVLSLVAWALLVVSCVLALRESQSALERARAKVLLAGGAAIPSLPLAVGLWFGAEVPGGSLSLMTITVAMLPLPVGYAISHYRLFDLAVDLRRAISHVLYVAASAVVISGLVLAAALATGATLPLGDPVLLFAVVFCAFLVGDPLRARLRGVIDSWMSPAAQRMAAAAEEHVGRMAELLEPEDCARLLARAVAGGVECAGISVFLMEEEDWRLAHARGTSAPVRGSAAATAAKVLAGRELLSLADLEPPLEPGVASLRELGVEVVAALRSGEECVGILLLAVSGRAAPLTTQQLRFVETLAKQSAVAVHNAHLARSLLVSERLATQGRLGAGLIHDLGKPLGVIERLAARIPNRRGDPDRVLRDGRTIAELSAQMRATLRDFLDSTRRAAAGGPEVPVEADTLVDRAIRIVERSHGAERVSARLEPGLRPLRGGGEKIVRALANLLDNALLASDPGEVVEVAVRVRRDDLEFLVIDRGCGMDASVRERAFEPFFSTRPQGRGNGLGLAVCRDLIEGLGGSVGLESAPGRGTRVWFRVPLAPGPG